MSVLEAAHIKYADALAAVGQFVAQKGLNDICLMEFEGGIVVVGAKLYETPETFNRQIETHVLTLDDLRQLIKEAR